MTRLLLCLSGGFDSALAGHLMNTEKYQIDALHFSQQPFVDDSPQVKSTEIAEKLGLDSLRVMNIGNTLQLFTKQPFHRYYFVLMKRLMMRCASSVAHKLGDRALITGECLGQVSSQTLPNLEVIDQAATLPVLRPLIAYDKREIIDQIRDLKLFDVCSGPEMCDVLGPRYPTTAANLEKVNALEEEVPNLKDAQSESEATLETLEMVTAAYSSSVERPANLC